ncbi:hypothetical protein BDQ17DRAFT_1441687 [Cyathus striatus]|nr:hypothetical protein BDQ17DRAFT_1441687 [Cyathus striatus]
MSPSSILDPCPFVFVPNGRPTTRTCHVTPLRLVPANFAIKTMHLARSISPRQPGLFKVFPSRWCPRREGTVQEWNGDLSTGMILGIVYHSGSASLKVLPIRMNVALVVVSFVGIMGLIVGYATFGFF